MPITQFSKEYHEKMFPGYESDFLHTDPEFIERFDNFAFDEVINQEGQGLPDACRPIQESDVPCHKELG
jgi:4-carboxymuconolactone decarboxylase